MKLFSTATAIVLMLALAPLVIPQCPDERDTSRFTLAKVAIANRVLKQMKARLDTCTSQPKAKQSLCEEWADAGNKAAQDVQAAAFTEIDKLAAAR